MISMDKKYTTCTGRPVRLLCVDGPGKWPVIGLIDNDVWRYRADGTCFCGDFDLIEVRTAEDVVRDVLSSATIQHWSPETIVTALREAGLLVEGA